MAAGDPLPTNAVVSPEVDVTVAGAPAVALPVANPTVEPSSGGTTTITAAVQNIPDGSQAGLGTGPQNGPYTDTGLRATTASSSATFSGVQVPADPSPTPAVVAYVVFFPAP